MCLYFKTQYLILFASSRATPTAIRTLWRIDCRTDRLQKRSTKNRHHTESIREISRHSRSVTSVPGGGVAPPANLRDSNALCTFSIHCKQPRCQRCPEAENFFCNHQNWYLPTLKRNLIACKNHRSRQGYCSI